MPAATVVVTLPSSTRAVVFGIERRDVLTTGTAPARRVGFLYTYPTPLLANATGWALFDAAIDWAVAT